MLKKILTVAIFAGVLSGLGISVVQEFTTTPIILHAEEYENAKAPGGNEFAQFIPANFVLVHSGESHPEGEEAWGPEDGLERSLYTALANIITGVGFALILVACYAMYGKPVNGRQGVIWGIAAFTAFMLAPSLGLPPEVPGSMAADLVSRQSWWIPTAVGTAIGLWLMVFKDSWPLRLLGLFILIVPHAIGAPHPGDVGGNVPPEIAGHFVAASLVTAAIFWAMLGWVSGTLFDRLSNETS
jgi:cobalt transporter subunit CbtA